MADGFPGWVSVQSETLDARLGESLADAALGFVGERSPKVRGNLVTVLAPEHREVDIGISHSGKTYLGISSGIDGAPLPSPGLLLPWLGCRTCRFGRFFR